MGYAALEGRYELVRELGRGGQGVTWEARSLEDGRLVAIKVLDLKDVQDWKHVELIEREAKTLQSLDHPAIPDYVDFIRDDQEDGQLRLFMVQELVQGKTLEQELRERGRWDEAKLEQDAAQLLKILDYLHKRVPPVVHRDIKPSNIIRSQEDGRLYLIDFGAVRGDQERSTMIGTPGYMPLEQLVNRTEPRSDLYSLGVTLFKLLTGVEPIDVELRDGKLDYMALVERREGVAALLSKMIEPNVEGRIVSAERALALLRDPSQLHDEGLPSEERAALLARLHRRDVELVGEHDYSYPETAWMPEGWGYKHDAREREARALGFEFLCNHIAFADFPWIDTFTKGFFYRVKVQVMVDPTGSIYMLRRQGDGVSAYYLFTLLEDGRRLVLHGGSSQIKLYDDMEVYQRGGTLLQQLRDFQGYIQAAGVAPVKGLSPSELKQAFGSFFTPYRADQQINAYPFLMGFFLWSIAFWIMIPLLVAMKLRAGSDRRDFEQMKAKGAVIQDPVRYVASLHDATDEVNAQVAVKLDFEGAQAAQEEMAQHELSHQARAKP